MATTLVGIPLDQTLAVAGANSGRSPTPAWTVDLLAQPAGTGRRAAD
jgi:hypothetical protein